jgi:hypothetical protein
MSYQRASKCAQAVGMTVCGGLQYVSNHEVAGDFF